MANKNFVVSFKLPQLPAAHYWQSTEVEASDIGMAVKKAWAIIKQRPVVKGRRLKSAQVSIDIVT